jgi:hypothetical protein
MGVRLALHISVFVALFSCNNSDTNETATADAGTCVTCNTIITAARATNFVCAGKADDTWGELVLCMCKGDCATDCADACQNKQLTDACRSCYAMSCPSELDACMAN